ncbi:MAG: hypothetical protein ACLSHW_10975 [Lachnospiraceae bacterium]
MFTHFGVTGPLILSASSQIPKKFRGQELTLFHRSQAGPYAGTAGRPALKRFFQGEK